MLPANISSNSGLIFYLSYNIHSGMSKWKAEVFSAKHEIKRIIIPVTSIVAQWQWIQLHFCLYHAWLYWFETSHEYQLQVQLLPNYQLAIFRIIGKCETVNESCVRITGNDKHIRIGCFTLMGNMYSTFILSKLNIAWSF